MAETAAADANADARARQLVELIEEFVAETRSRQVSVNLDDALERGLGLDSLARVELLLRTERAFGVSLPDHLLNSVETPRDLLRSVLAAAGAPATVADHTVKALAAGGEHRVPQLAATLVEALDWHVSQHAARLHIHLYEEDNEQPISYGELAARARTVAKHLVGRGIEPGNAVAIMLPTGAAYFFTFFGILLAGGVPVPIYPPARPAQIEEHLRRHAAILANAQARILVTVPEARPVALLLRSQVESLKAVLTVSEAMSGDGLAEPVRVSAQDIAFLQYTSGSTGNPKGVVLTHANLLANVRAMGEVVAPGPDDVFVSWLPLYHDMGLIGAWFCSLYFGMPLAIMSPLAFLARPQRWLWAIHRHRGTLSAAPNFAYELCARKIADRDLEGLDLSSWRCAFNGAEPVSPDTLAAFAQRFARYGLRAEALAPVYGLAENSVGLCLPQPGRGPVVDLVDRDIFAASGRAQPARAGDAQARRFVGCGMPLPGHQIRIVGGTGFELGERQAGRVQFKGPSATAGYYRNADETRRLFAGEWLDSGDYGYIAAGEVYLTGRAKDVIIRGGRNLYPYELEQAVGNIAGVRRGCVAVFGSREAHSGTERLVVLAETRETQGERQDALRRAINDCAVDLLGMPADDVVLAPAHAVLKTSSGKIRRAACRELYERGGAIARPVPLWAQIARVAWTSAFPQLKRWGAAASAWAYAAYAWGIFLLFAPLVWLAVVITARPQRIRPFIRGVARLLLRLTRMSLFVSGLENLPRTPCVVAANHTSYLDAILLTAALPADYPYAFVAKREFLDRFITRRFFEGAGCVFVERFDARAGVEQAAQVGAALGEGKVLIFFPEGTFDRRPGLRPFRSGAFSVAVKARVPVVPLAIRGARSMLRENDWFPYRGAAGIAVSAAIQPAGADWRDVIGLRDRVRAEILKHCGEPDLAA